MASRQSLKALARLSYRGLPLTSNAIKLPQIFNKNEVLNELSLRRISSIPSFDFKSANTIGYFPGYSLRQSTAAVAERLSQQTQFPLVVGTPYTVEGAWHNNPADQARIIIDISSGYKIVHSNSKIEELLGFSYLDLIGKQGISFLEGPLTDIKNLNRIHQSIFLQKRIRLYLKGYKKSGESIDTEIQISPLMCNSGQVTHILGIIQAVC